MSTACNNMANVINFYPNELPKLCDTRYCNWEFDDYFFNIGNSTEQVMIYSLSHLALHCDIYRQLETVPVRLPFGPVCFNTPLCGQGSVEEVFCKAGSNIVTYLSNSSNSSVAYTCPSNYEGTGWEYRFEHDVCLDEETHSEWLIQPFPGTPVCNSSLFVIKRLYFQCFMSTCNRSVETYQVRDLRQCMLYACINGANVINYYSNGETRFVNCDLRYCNPVGNGEYDLKLANRAAPGYDIYALFYHEASPTTAPTKMTSVPRTEASTSIISTAITETIKLNTTTSSTTRTEAEVSTISSAITEATSTFNTTTSSATRTQAGVSTSTISSAITQATGASNMTNTTAKAIINDHEKAILRTITITLGIILFIAICVIVILPVMYRRQPAMLKQRTNFGTNMDDLTTMLEKVKTQMGSDNVAMA
ncbi:unnamed protein product [Owenia fusiformis]|uniref:Uncharacterized protein n=1 Tax=Owenia fusiformis TaxID=6347 RepID=A0A8J1Y7F2_OWEFU|nr:unnamed protein product [Owenia fusiformis]